MINRRSGASVAAGVDASVDVDAWAGSRGQLGANHPRSPPVTVDDATWGYADVVRRFVFAPRWVVGHVVMVIMVVSCVLLGRWQWHRAESTHSLQNYAYALQWPLFAVFFAVMWWRMLRLESLRLDDAARSPDREAVSAGPVVEPERPPPPARAVPPRPEGDDPELAAYNRMLAELAALDRAEH